MLRTESGIYFGIIPYWIMPNQSQQLLHYTWEGGRMQDVLVAETSSTIDSSEGVKLPGANEGVIMTSAFSLPCLKKTYSVKSSRIH